MRGVVCRTRQEWIRKVLGPNKSLTVKNVVRMYRCRWDLGWVTAAPAQGPAYERIAMVHRNNPLFQLVCQYRKGSRCFDRAVVETALNGSVASTRGARCLAKVGLAICQFQNGRIELRAADPREALCVNEARCCPRLRGHRGVIESLLHLRRPGTRRINVDDNRRVQAHDILMKKWGIRCDDLMLDRKRVRLVSSWTFQQAAA